MGANETWSGRIQICEAGTLVNWEFRRELFLVLPNCCHTKMKPRVKRSFDLKTNKLKICVFTGYTPSFKCWPPIYKILTYTISQKQRYLQSGFGPRQASSLQASPVGIEDLLSTGFN